MKINLSPEDVECKSQREKLIASMKTTAINRYNASNRLKWQSKFAFTASTSFSLGLIFIPLMQLSKVPLRLNGDVLSAIQIFLAVAILVYSVIIGTSRFEVRGEQLNDCGDSIKKLIRELRISEQSKTEAEEVALLKEFQEKYAIIVADVENHVRSDYILTIIRTPDLFKLGFFARAHHWLKYFFSAIVPYVPPIILVAIELILISDMFGISKIFSQYLNINPCL